ncbi:hypothetical protein BO221_20485 [Archangium sp. Cb G35]|uniref:S46 family peptidase n=1 Tax=Archangium sp. Cb G35 TaxID=1920190 RepID=UPI000937796B|nr:S46 family peptidase [Archangium sp. Cb G35]OJT23245.1 hypothetical protein BO221_20485 [Archangium sp. Cb G35]
MEINKLLRITDVTSVLTKATQGKESAAFRDAQRAEIARLEKECSMGGDFGFDEASNRTVSVHSEGLLEGLREVYNARRLLEESGRGRGR